MLRTFLIVSTILYFSSCQKEHVDSPEFEVTTTTLSYTTADTAHFQFSGNPNFITFYSGELGHRYAYRNRVTAAGTPTLQFTSSLGAGSQSSSLHIMVSNNFAGVVLNDTVATAANITAATWTDITNRATVAGSTTAVKSGPIDLSDFVTAGKPVYIAFKYVAVSGAVQNKWTVTALSVTNTLPDFSVYTIANLEASSTAINSNYAEVATFSPGWVAFPVSNTYNWVVTNGSSLVIAGAATTALATDGAEAWAIMGPLDLQKVTPDVGIAVKSIAAVVNSYFYNFKSPGNYAATFVATNENSSESKKSVKNFNIVVN